MIISKKICALIIACTSLAACDTSVTPTYQATPANTIALQSIATSGKKANVATVVANADVELTPTCRLLGPIDVGGGKAATEALQDALTAELLAGGVYGPNGTPITLQLTKMEPSSMNGYWILAGRVMTAKLPAGFDVETRYDFRTSFSAYSACENTAVAFNRAAAQFINDIVTHPNFRSAL